MASLADSQWFVPIAKPLFMDEFQTCAQAAGGMSSRSSVSRCAIIRHILADVVVSLWHAIDSTIAPAHAASDAP
ncbi:hypothetical protein MRX96_002101 [Rhipicephalus microplus]